MDILHLIDRLEEELSQGHKLPFTSIVLVNEQRLWDIIDNMHTFIPEEVQRAQQVERERERILAQAREEAGRIVDLARKRSEELTSSHELVQRARAEAQEIVSRARSEAQGLQLQADSYALDVLVQMEEQLKRVLQTVHNGERLLSGRKGTRTSPDSEI